MLKKIGIALVVIVGIFVVVVATRPPTFHIERSIVANASPDAIYPLITDFHQWVGWSPWEKLDTGMQKKFDGPAAGVGAKYWWSGNDKVGEGRMTVEEAKPSQSAKIRIEFLKPFAANNMATFTLVPSGKSTTITWAMDGDNNFMAKAFHMFMDMDKMIGGDFEKGLAGIKELSEKEAAQRAEAAKKAEEARKAAESAAAAAAAAAQADAGTTETAAK